MSNIDAIKQKVGKLVVERGLSFHSLSLRLGKNSSYLQKFVKEKSPRRLDEEFRKGLAKILNIPEQELTDIPLDGNMKTPLLSENMLSITEENFKEIISTAYTVFTEYLEEFKSNESKEDIAQKIAEACLSAAKAETTDRKGQLKGIVINLYQKKAG